MKYYPIHIDIKNKPCLVVGGGRVAERKVMKLSKAGAAITVISKELTPALTELIQKSNVIFLQRQYQTSDVKGFFLVFAATNNKEVNKQVYDEAQRHNILVNSLNGIEEGDFILPALCAVGDLHVGVTTQGQSPALSARLRRYFQSKLSVLTNKQVNEVAVLRNAMLTAGKSQKEKLCNEMNVLIDELILSIEENNVNLNDI